MSKLRIFIEGKELDSLDSVTVPITKQFEELSDPTVICNDYSKTVTVPLSKNNNDIFGHCYNPDRLIAAGDDDTPLVGIYFDPYKKLDCRLQWGDDVFFIGYAKMLKVTNKGYEVTINGELGKIFQELQKITFDKSKYEDEEDIEKYWIDGSKYVNTQINKELVYKCWNSTQDDYTLRETTDSAYDITDIIGFIPNNSFSEDFNYDSYEYYNEDNNNIETQTFSECLEKRKFGSNTDETFQEYTKYTPDSIIGDGFYPEQMREWRSYNQIPFIYWNKFWQIFQKKSEELTGYEWDLTDSWFGDTNVNYIKLATTLLNRDNIISKEEDKVDTSFSVSTVYNSNFYLTKNHINDIGFKLFGTTFVNNNSFNTNGGSILLKLNLSFKLQINNVSGADTTAFGFRYGDLDGGLLFKIKYGDNILEQFILCDQSDGSFEAFKSAYPLITKFIGIQQQAVEVASGGYIKANISISDPLYIKIDKSYGNNELKITAEPIFAQTSIFESATVFTFIGVGGQFSTDTICVSDAIQCASGNDATQRETYFRSNDSFTLNDICNFDFSNILDYCKRFRINIFLDETNKKLKFSRHYFDDYTIIDKTDKIDKSSTFDVSPITFDTKTILFSYADTKSLLGETYKNIYGYPYGTKKISTEYNFSNDSKSLFEKSNESIIYSPSYIYWSHLNTQYPILEFWNYNNIFLETRDSDGKTINNNFVYFYATKTLINTKLNESSQIISDDSNAMSRINQYYYLDRYNGAPFIVTNYWTLPNLVMQIDGAYPIAYNTCLFEKPMKDFTTKTDYWSSVISSVYSSYWETYLNERYNIQNKKVTTYIRLTPSDFINFKFNQFWKIGNQIYIVNKIYDYDITSDKPTKVDLITVQNIEAYKK